MNASTRLQIIFCSLCLISTALPAVEYRYQDPASINLATIRGVKATASQNLKKGLAATALHNGVGDISFIANPCWRAQDTRTAMMRSSRPTGTSCMPCGHSPSTGRTSPSA